ncbi:MAG: MGMT family protein [Planctomycetales bacterium]|nr:MGMT family protein [Planctomycetales bacterium]
MARRKTWLEKLRDSKDLPKVVRVAGKGRMAIASPLEVDALMRRVPRGRVTTIAELRESIARRHRADFACPLTTGIFAWIAAHAAEEARAAGARRVTPWWRTLKAGGVLNEKYPGGTARQRRLLQAEGHRVERRGARLVLASALRAP